MASAKRELGNMSLTVSKTSLHDQQDEISYWLGVSPAERIAAVEVLRKRVFGGADGTRQGLQRVCRIIPRT